MRRSDVLKLTGLKADFFTSLLRKGSIPFAQPESEKHAAGWGTYSAGTVFLTRIALELARLPLTQFEVSRFVETERGLLFGANPSLSKLADQEIWFGFVRLGSTEPNPEHGGIIESTFKHPLCGSLTEVVGQIQTAAPRGNTSQLESYDCVITNASRSYRALLARANELGLSERLFQELTLEPTE